jgi:DNA-binding transcriptional regulator YhcF (GntR family)
MAVAILENLDMQRHATVPIYQHLAEQIIDRIRSGNLNAGDKLPTEHRMAEHLGINRLTVRKSYQVLEERNLVERFRGMGTFILARQADTIHNKQTDNILYFLIPYSNFFMASDQSGIMARRLYMGMCDALSLANVKLIPVSQEAAITLDSIDYSVLEQITSGSTVDIEGVWYSKLFPFFAERDIHGIFVGDLSEKTIALQHNYCSILNNRRGAIEDSVCYLANLGYKRIAVLVSGDGIDPHGTFMSGYKDGLNRSSLAYDPTLAVAFQTKKMFPKIDHRYFKKTIAELWQIGKFDALLLSVPDISTTVATIIQQDLGLKIPDNVALMAVHDRMEHINFPVPITAIEFPWYDIGVEAHKLLDNKMGQPHSIQFNATIIERESTRKGAGSFANTKLLPEYNNLQLTR